METIDHLELQAVEEAVHFRWSNAIALNKDILSIDKNNLPAHLRLGFAFLQTQKFEEAYKFYRKALKIQPNSTVAKENLERIKVLQEGASKKSPTATFHLDPNLFLDISGKTKGVSLVNLGQKKILAILSIGEEIFLKPKKRKIEVRTKDSEYIGSLPDDLSKRLLVFMKAKCEYIAHIKEANLNKINVFIKETKKGKKVLHFLSFPQNIQAHMGEVSGVNQDKETEGDEDITENDLEKLAESLTSEDKEYLPYKQEAEEEAEE